MQENIRLRTIYSVPYAEMSMLITKDELHERLVSEGTSPGTPKSRGLINGMVLDAEVCEQATCESCRYKGLELVTIWTTLRIYRAAVAVCSQCNEALEC